LPPPSLNDFTDYLVALNGDFEYLLHRIGCNEYLSDNFFTSETSYREFQGSCHALLESKKSGKLKLEQFVEICRAFVDTLAPHLDPRLLASKVMEFHQEVCVNMMQVDTNPHEIRPEVHAIISEGWDTAWETKYENRALENFQVYLQNLWIERRRRWRRNHPPAYSPCATIVQSSCAGKSRLVYSYIIRLSEG